MNKKLRILSFLTALLLLASLCSCGLGFIPNLPQIGGRDEEPFVPNEITEVVATSFENSYGDQLSPNERVLYDTVAAAKAGENEFTVTLPEPVTVCKNRAPTEEEQNNTKERLTYWISNALFAIWMDEPALFWLDFGDYRYTCTFKQNEERIVGVTELTVTVSLRTDSASAVSRKDLLDAVLKAYTPYGANDAERVRSINRFLCDKVTYNLDAPDRGTAVGALVDGSCVCEGYARAFQLLCQRAGITCVCILGDSMADGEREGHMWNAVRIDGVWYYCDPTWNDTTERLTKYLLVGGETPGVKDKDGNTPTFDETHIPQNTLGQSKPFALPAVSKTAR